MKILTTTPTPKPGMFVMFAKKCFLYLGDSETGRAKLHPVNGTKQIEVSLDQLKILSSERVPVEKLKELEDYPEHLVEIAKQRRAALQALFDNPPDKENVQRVAKKLGVSVRTVQRLFENYLFTGQRLSALIPRAMFFGIRNRKLNEDQIRIMQEVIKEKFLVKEKPSFESVAEAVRRACRNAEVKPVGRTTVLRELRKLDPGLVVTERLGKKAAREKFKAHRGKAPIGERPLDLVEIDHTQVDVFIVLPSGKAYRPWITLAIDTYSRMVLGFFLTMDEPSRLSVGLCLYRAMTPKSGWLRQHGITTSWPCFGRMVSIIADNAKEFRGYFLQEVGLEHDIVICFRPIGQPNWGAHIERLMGRVADEMHLLPGTSFANPVEKGDYDSDKHATLTLEQLEKFFLHYIVEVYHCSPHTGLNGRTPLSRWESYYAQTGNEQGPHLPQIQAGSDLLISLLPSIRRTIQQSGVAWESLQYNDSVLTEYIQRPNPLGPDNLWRFSFDPRDIRCLYWRHPETRQAFSIPLTGTSAPGMTLWELTDYQANDRAEAEATHDQATVDRGRNAMDEIVRSSEPLPLKDHRKRVKRVKEAATATPPPSSILTITAPHVGLTLPLGSQPVETSDPLMWVDLQPFEVDPLFDPNSTQFIGGTRVP